MRVLSITCSCILFVLIWAAAPAAAQTDLPAKNTAAAAPAPAVKAAGYLYKGIGIGMLADDVREKLGDPKDKSDPQDLFVFGNDESAQFIYGPDKKVTAIMITFSGKLSEAPTPRDVLGEDVAPNANGGISKLVRFPKAGYWISYNKIVGDDSIISIAVQKL